jgi:hypothetical protein
MYTADGYGTQTGGLSYIESIVDLQQGPTCGLEAVENVVQMFFPARNDLQDTHLIPLATRSGMMMLDSDGPWLHPAGYKPLLQAFRIRASWYAFDHGVLVEALRANRVVIAVVDAHQIDCETYPPESGHAVVITNIVLDPSRKRLVGYVGMDSNHPGQERVWDALALEQAARFPDHGPLLITDSPARFPNEAEYYMQLVSGVVLPVKRLPKR